MLNPKPDSAGRAALAAVGLSLIALTACSGGPGTQAAPGGGGAAARKIEQLLVTRV